MIKLKIDSKTTFAPLAMAKGTTEERLQKARLLNIKFLKSLKYDFVDREIKPATFKRTLKETTGKSIGIKLEPVEHQSETAVTSYLTSKGVNKGYLLKLPHTFLTNMIEQRHLSTIAKETQKMFNQMLNPKILKREFALFNKSSNIKERKNFVAENISGKNKLKEKALDKFLKDKAPQEQIDTLQSMRYNILVEQNLRKAEPLIDKQIEKMENLHIQGKNYDLSEYQYDEKMQILNNKLAHVLKTERAKHAEKISG